MRLKSSIEGGPPPPNPLGTCQFGLPYIDWLNNATIRQLMHIPNTV